MGKNWAIVTGADGGMGQVITKALVQAGYPVIMACKEPEKAAHDIKAKIETIHKEAIIEIEPINLLSLQSVRQFAERFIRQKRALDLLINNAGVLSTGFGMTENGFEGTVSVNYVGPYLLTRLLLPTMQAGSRIVNTVSCTYAIGKIESEFFEKGRNGSFYRIPIYGNTKLALLLFTRELASRLWEKGITANAADPGIVNTPMITMQQWFDPLTDILFRPFIKTAEQGAATAIHLALSPDLALVSGCCYANCKPKHLSSRILQHPQQKELWNNTEQRIKEFLSPIAAE